LNLVDVEAEVPWIGGHPIEHEGCIWFAVGNDVYYYDIKRERTFAL
jgi:hypothetical protein